MTSRDRWRWLLVCVLAVGALFAAVRGRRLRRAHAAAQFAARTVSHAGVTEACLLGRGGAFPAGDGALVARVRALALGNGGPAAWPATCADTLDERTLPLAADPEPEARAVCTGAEALQAALERPDASVDLAGFREGRTRWTPPGWLDALTTWHRAVAALARRHGLSVVPAGAPAVPRTALAAMSADVVPVPLRPGSVVTGWGFSAGTLSVLFLDPFRQRVFCRSRDRGVSIRCDRVTVPEGGVAVSLVGHDRPEALALVERGGMGSVEPMDSLGTSVFPLGAMPSRTLALRVARDVLVAMVDTPAGPALERVARGGAREVREPAGVAPGTEAVILAPEASGDGPASGWWLAAGTQHDAPVLVARGVSLDLAVPAGELQRLVALHSRTALVYGCQTATVGYAAVVDAPGGVLVAVEGGSAPRVLGTLDQADLPAEVICDEAGATVVGATSVQSCAREGGCDTLWRSQGIRRFARVGGDLVEARAAEGGGLRVRRGLPGAMARTSAGPLADDAAHGGADAGDLWIFTAGDHLVLVTLGETNAVLWSGDGGRTWHPSRESGDAR